MLQRRQVSINVSQVLQGFWESLGNCSRANTIYAIRVWDFFIASVSTLDYI